MDFSTNIIDISAVSYEHYSHDLINHKNAITHYGRIAPRHYLRCHVKEVFEKDSPLVLFAIRCIAGACLYIPVKLVGLLAGRKIEWIDQLFVRKKQYVVIDRSGKIDLSSKSAFIDVLNSGKYILNLMCILVPPAGNPATIRHHRPLQETLATLRKIGTSHTETKIRYADLSTEEAINVANNHFKIALSFANETHIGGAPGFHKDENGNFVYDTPSACAQEESLSQRSTLMASLTKLPHTLVKDSHSNMIRSVYGNLNDPNTASGFDSRITAIYSDNHLFAVQKPGKFYESDYLPKPQAVTFITSAAKCYNNEDVLDTSLNSPVYLDAKQRIETHLITAAYRAVTARQNNPRQQIELILGAFGCGAFVPRNITSANQYRQMIVSIYSELLPQFKGIFDRITFAVPTFGKNVPKNLEQTEDAGILNHMIFKSVIKNLGIQAGFKTIRS